MRPFIITIVLLAAGIAPAFSQKRDITDPAEINKIMEKSDLTYEINIVDIVSQREYNETIGNKFYYAEDSAGVRVIRTLELSENDFEIFVAAERDFGVENYEKAIERYHQILKNEPGYAPIMTNIGIAYFSLENIDSSLFYLEKAAEVNYSYYKSHYLLAVIHNMVENYEKAMFEMTIAHILDRNNATIKEKMLEFYAKNNLEWKDFTFSPDCEIKYGNAETVNITTSPAYFWYSMYRAVWLYEPGYKEKRKVMEPDRSVWAEKEAIFGLYLIATSETKDLKKIVKAMKKRPEIEALKYAVSQGYIEEYGIYESLLPRHPEVVFTLSKDEILTVAAYVLQTRGGYKFKEVSSKESKN